MPSRGVLPKQSGALAETPCGVGALHAGRDPSTARLLRIREAVASLRMTEPKVASSKRSNT
ncbi:MAG: hypothetical protein WCA76_04000, partial [Candidatus Sulfotelmatobacter sp.]